MRVLVVDDEPLARRRLLQLLAAEPDMNVVGEADGGREAIELVETLRPDIVLLDIEMPVVNGLAVVRAMPEGHAPAIIFVTAFQDHAVAAFDLRATDFVVKPVAAERLARALDQARGDLASRRANERLAVLQQRLEEIEQRTLEAADAGLWVQIGTQRLRLNLRDIRWLQAERDFVRVHLADKSVLVSAMLGEMEKRLASPDFVRIHRSTIVRRDAVKAVVRGRFSTPVLELADGQQLAIGRKYRDSASASLGFAA